jgi:hypothetical protein
VLRISVALMSPVCYVRTSYDVCVCAMKRGAPVTNSPYIKTIYCNSVEGVTSLLIVACACICVCVEGKCSFICLLVYDFNILFALYTPLLVCVLCCRINQLNYLWWWINRFVFR